MGRNNAGQPGYGSSDVLALTSASQSNLTHWTRVGAIEPDLAGTTGRGYHRRYSTLNLFEVQLCARLHLYHVDTGVMADAVAAFRWFHFGAVALYQDISSRLDGSRSAVGGTFERAFNDAADVHGGASAVDAARAWNAVRSSSLAVGQPDARLTDFVGLYARGGDSLVAVNPVRLKQLVEGISITVDLADLVFEVGEKYFWCSRHLKKEFLPASPVPW